MKQIYVCFTSFTAPVQRAAIKNRSIDYIYMAHLIEFNNIRSYEISQSQFRSSEEQL